MRDHLMGFPAAALGEQEVEESNRFAKIFVVYARSGSRAPAFPVGFPKRFDREWDENDAKNREKYRALFDFETGDHGWTQDGNEWVQVSEASCKTGQAEKVECDAPPVGLFGAGVSAALSGLTIYCTFARNAPDSTPEQPKPVVLTLADSLADLNGTRRPDNHIEPATDKLPAGVWRRDVPPEGTSAFIRFAGTDKLCCDDRYTSIMTGWIMRACAGSYEWLDESPAQPAQAPDGWIAHDGGPCPESVKGKTVEVRFRDGDTEKCQACSAVFFNQPGAESADVIAYRVL